MREKGKRDYLHAGVVGELFMTEGAGEHFPERRLHAALLRLLPLPFPLTLRSKQCCDCPSCNRVLENGHWLMEDI